MKKMKVKLQVKMYKKGKMFYYFFTNLLPFT